MFLATYSDQMGQVTASAYQPTLSELRKILYGVPLGSVLGPILLCFSTTPLSKVIVRLPFHFYADDTWLLIHLTHKNVTPMSFERLNRCLEDVKNGYQPGSSNSILIKSCLSFLAQSCIMKNSSPSCQSIFSVIHCILQKVVKIWEYCLTLTSLFLGISRVSVCPVSYN